MNFRYANARARESDVERYGINGVGLTNGSSRLPWGLTLLMAAVLAMVPGYTTSQKAIEEGQRSSWQVNVTAKTTRTSNSSQSLATANQELHCGILSSGLTLPRQEIKGLGVSKAKVRTAARHKKRRIHRIFINLQNIAKVVRHNPTPPKTIPEKGWDRSQSRYG